MHNDRIATVCLFDAGVAVRRFSHCEFTIEESDGWKWTHNDFAANGVTGRCQTVFEAIDAVDNWNAAPRWSWFTPAVTYQLIHRSA